MRIAATIVLLVTVLASQAHATPEASSLRSQASVLAGMEFGRWGLLGGSGSDSRNWFVVGVGAPIAQLATDSRLMIQSSIAIQTDPAGDYGIRLIEMGIAWELFVVDAPASAMEMSLLLGGSIGFEIFHFGSTSDRLPIIGRYATFGLTLGLRCYLFERVFFDVGTTLQYGVSVTTINDCYAWRIPLAIGVLFD